MAAGRQITLRLVIADPVPGVAYSLQDKTGQPVGAVVAGDGSLSFMPVRVADGPRFLGDHVCSEGPVRRFVYIAIGTMAGHAGTHVQRRAKIDIHTLDAELLDSAFAGAVLEARLPGRARDGGPSCGTVPPLGPWRAVSPEDA